MRDLFSWLWRKPQIIWVVIPFALGTVVSTAVLRSLGDDDAALKFVKGVPARVAASSMLHREKRVKKVKNSAPEKELSAGEQTRVKGDLPQSALVSEGGATTMKTEENKAKSLLKEGPSEPSAAPGPARAGVTSDPKREALKAEMERKVKLEGEERQEKSQAEALADQIQQQKVMAQQLTTKLAQKVVEQERELELRRLARAKSQAELVRQQETEKLAELKRISEESRLAKEKLIAEQAKIARDEEIDRARKIAEQERSTLEAKIKAKRDEDLRIKAEQDLQAAREKMATELSKLEEEKAKAQKLRYEREKEFMLEQLKVESLKAKLAAQERSLLERDLDKTAGALHAPASTKPSDMAAAAMLKKKFETGTAISAATVSTPSPKGARALDQNPKKAHEPKEIVDFVNVVIHQAVDKLALSFDIQKSDPHRAFARGHVLIIGKYLDHEGKPVFASSLTAEKGGTQRSDGAEGIAFKVKNVVKKNLEISHPAAGGKLVDLWIVARDQQGNNISTQRVAHF